MTGNKAFLALLAAGAVLLLADLFYDKHAHFPAEGWFGFYGGFAFGAGVVAVLAARFLRRLVKRDEDYHD